jgi:hypothetical protein
MMIRAGTAFFLLLVSVGSAPAQEDCCNRIDDDGDGRIDFDDADCAGTPECPIPFRRGDVDQDGRVNLADVIVLIRVVAGRLPNLHLCDEAKDVNDDGDRDVTDAIVLLQWLFRSGPPPPEPFPDCGFDPTPDNLLCLMLSEC